jgi:hypothetical protein
MPNQAVPISEQVQEFNQKILAAWWSFPFETPGLGKTYTLIEQQVHEAELDRFVDSLLRQLKDLPADLEARRAVQEQVIARGFDFAGQSLEMSAAQLNLIRQQGFLDAGRRFAQMAREFDPTISADDIYQAGRNVMTMNFIQVLLGMPVEITPAVFAYSMLYPYTDNYIDDANVPSGERRAFNRRFRDLLEGKAIQPANPHEEIICRLVEMIERQYKRARYPQVYASLLAIHTAQARSLQLICPGAAPKGVPPYELDVLGLSFEKGGTSVLADGYLIAGDLSAAQAGFLYTYGAYTQLMDDLEDVAPDRRAGRMTIFSQCAGHWPLDALTNRTFRLGARLFEDVSMFPGAGAPLLKEIIAGNINPVLIDTAARAHQFYTPGYLRGLEKYMPFRYRALEKQRNQLQKKHVALTGWIEVFL